MKRQKRQKITSGEGWTFNAAGAGGSSTPAGSKAVVKLRMERRRGKPTTILYEMSGVPSVVELSRNLKQMLSAGGTFKNGQIEIQGEHRDRIRNYLQEQGYLVKG